MHSPWFAPQTPYCDTTIAQFRYEILCFSVRGSPIVMRAPLYEAMINTLYGKTAGTKPSGHVSRSLIIAKLLITL